MIKGLLSVILFILPAVTWAGNDSGGVGILNRGMGESLVLDQGNITKEITIENLQTFQGVQKVESAENFKNELKLMDKFLMAGNDSGGVGLWQPVSFNQEAMTLVQEAQWENSDSMETVDWQQAAVDSSMVRFVKFDEGVVEFEKVQDTVSGQGARIQISEEVLEGQFPKTFKALGTSFDQEGAWIQI